MSDPSRNLNQNDVKLTDLLLVPKLLGLCSRHGLNLHRPTRILLPINRLEEILGPVIRRQPRGILGRKGLDPLIGEEVELGVHPFAVLVDQLEGVAVVPVHVAETVGDPSVAEEDHDLVDRLGVLGEVVPEVRRVVGWLDGGRVFGLANLFPAHQDIH